MAPNISYTKFSPSGKVAYAITNGVALMEKESVHADFHLLMDFLKNSPISYALTASPTIYAEIVQEMWSTADCSNTRGEIKFTIKGNSYIITPSVINEALHFPESNFENTPTQSELISLLKVINYFDTLNKSFAGKCSSYDTINTFVLKIGYSLFYGRRIDIGTLLLDEFCYKFGALQERDNIIYYRTISPCITEDGNEENGTAPEVHLPQKNKDASKVSSLSVADHEMPPEETRDGIPALELPSSPEEEKPICGLLVPAQEPDDHQYLLNAASVLKSNLVDRLTSFANILSAEDMILLANKCYNTLEGLGDFNTDAAFMRQNTSLSEVDVQHEDLALAAKKKEDWNELDIKSCYIHKAQSLFEVRQKLSRAKDKLSTAKRHEDSLKLKKEELTGALNKLTEELHEVEERVKTLTAERDQYKEAHSVAEAEVGKLEAEKEEARVAFKAINDQYIAANKEFEKTRNHLLQLVRK
ncbi:hypothetical protein POM88_034726 [Heracleum sosnowskyi]|uniref:Uncharacterized protein n=1 Tax=Heracleum sosnowskyi TaxID=360622 RepID=A0AAD8HK48_9APIA|nr:hypothetical protein POM88_034726 [Heracleum sosnowskyi]